MEVKLRWEPISEKPTEEAVYLVTVEQHGTTFTSTAFWGDSEWHSSFFRSSQIKAWIPLPEPYKESV